MKFSLGQFSSKDFQGDALIAFAHEGEKPALDLPKPMQDELSRVLAAKLFVGKREEVIALSSLGSAGFKRLYVVGLGKKEAFSFARARFALGAGAAIARDQGCEKVGLMLPSTTPDQWVRAAAEGVLIASYKFTKYKTAKNGEERVLKEVVLNAPAKCAQALEVGIVMGDSANLARDLNNDPPNVATPEFMAQRCVELAKANGIECEVFDKRALEKMGMNAILSVNAGSPKEPRFVVLKYGKGAKPLAFVGKGITFDSGGISIKPANDMDKMRFDKSGACAVVAAMVGVARLKLPGSFVGVVAFTENMPGGAAYKPGDFVKSYNGKTMEILNTDAEGRVLLSDALAYTCKEFSPKAIVDLATLTGACVVALGDLCAGVMGNNAQLEDNVIAAGEEVHERCWRLPLWPEYDDKVRGEFADVKNIGEPANAGAQAGASFLKAFVADGIPWAHVDIAGTAYLSKTNAQYRAQGATGFGARLLLELALRDKK